MDLKFIHFCRGTTGVASRKVTGASKSEIHRDWRESFVSGSAIFRIRLQYFSWRKEPDSDSIADINTIINGSGSEELVVCFNSLQDLEDLRSSGICKRKVWEF